jgi:hypothetical protein
MVNSQRTNTDDVAEKRTEIGRRQQTKNTPLEDRPQGRDVFDLGAFAASLIGLKIPQWGLNTLSL